MYDLGTVLKIVELLAFVGGFLVFIFRGGQSTQRMEVAITTMSDQLKEVKNEVTEFRGVLTQVALQNQRLDTQGSQIAVLQKELSDLRRGEGFIFPLAAQFTPPRQSG